MRKPRDPSWLSCAELAAAKLPGMPTSKHAMISLAERRGWFALECEGVLWRPRQGRGGGKEVHVRVLPAGLRARARRANRRARLAVIAAHIASLRTALEMLEEEQASLLRDEESA